MKTHCGDLRKQKSNGDLRSFIFGAAIVLFFCSFGFASNLKSKTKAEKPVLKAPSQPAESAPAQEKENSQASSKVVTPAKKEDGAALAPSKGSAPQGAASIPTERMTPGQGKISDPKEEAKLRQNFSRTVYSKKQALRHQQEIELGELTRRQEKQKQKWKVDQDIRRKNFYDAVKSPIPRRQFERQEERMWIDFLSSLDKVKFLERNEYSRKLRELENRQQTKRKQLEEYIKKGEYPPATFWQ